MRTNNPLGTPSLFRRWGALVSADEVEALGPHRGRPFADPDLEVGPQPLPWFDLVCLAQRDMSDAAAQVAA